MIDRMAEVERNQKAADAERLAKRAREERLVEDLIASWNDLVQQAARRDGVHFVVVVEFASGPLMSLPSELEPLVSDIEAHGYRAEYEDLDLRDPYPPVPQSPSDEREGRFVVDLKTLGWRPSNVPVFGDPPEPHSGRRLRPLVVMW
jgi:hypothetical protein